jgi:hypothetical protein
LGKAGQFIHTQPANTIPTTTNTFTTKAL